MTPRAHDRHDDLARDPRDDRGLDPRDSRDRGLDTRDDRAYDSRSDDRLRDDRPGTDLDRREDDLHDDRRDDRAGDTGDTIDTSGGGLGSAWVGLVLGAVITILLLIFILQNQESTLTQFLAWEFTMPLGVLMLFAAIAGALIMAMFAGFRILQLRMRARAARKAQRGRR